uniref:phosphomevalonate kinase n=1 Tax=Haslea ostrearia TaxID=67476 RepID=A0A3G5BBY4_HASOS|nr:phosphomevalonate kinase [Haslea ostrearia]
MTTTTVSAPGKVLFAGGYLVLESPNIGYVVAADKRFYTEVKNDDNKQSSSGVNTVVVDSPQFHSSWTYEVQTKPDEEHVVSVVPSSENSSVNPFVEKTLRVMSAYILQTGNASSLGSLVVKIQADNDFYSVIPHLNGKARTTENVDALPRFLKCPLDETTGKAVVNKTGLGSSAALTTSLVGALYEHFVTVPKEEAERKMEIHNLAQICHCYAQGKVGSGFDVSSAMNGSHLYKRFPKCVLPDLLQELAGGDGVKTSTGSLLDVVVKKTWSEDMAKPLPVPKGLQVLLADVCGGSESPSMARKVLAWKSSQQSEGSSAIPHWDDLKEINVKVAEIMQKLASETIDTTSSSVLSKHPASEWKSLPKSSDNDAATELLIELYDTFLKARGHLRAMGEAAGVPIEPPEQTKLCDETMKVPGVITALVPGAGGYDAVACLYIDSAETKTAIGELWANWNENKQMICPLSVQATHQGISKEA